MKTLINRIILLAVLLSQSVVVDLQAQIVNSESFDGTFPPAGWTLPNNPSLWVQRTNGTFPTCTPHSGTAMARFTARMQQPGTQDVFISPVFDLSGSAGSTPTVSLWIFRDSSSTAGDSLTIMVNTTASETGAVRIGAVARSRYFFLPVNQLVNGWYQYTFNVPPSFNTSTNYIVLRGTSQNGANIYIDDVEWDEYPTPCSGQPIAGTVQADRTLICGGPGAANLSLTGGSTGFGGLVYQWQSAPDSTGPWTDVGGNDNSYNTGTLAANTWFRCHLTCTPSGLADTTAALQIRVVSSPVPVVTVTSTTNLVYCTGYSPLVLVASGASSYTWTPNIAVPNGVGDTALAAPTVNTNYTIVGSDTSGCTGSTTVSVQVRTTPVITATTTNDTICVGQSTQLQAQLSGPGFGLQVQWQPGGLLGLNQTVSPTATTSYVVSATSIQSGCAGRDTVVVEVFTVPVPAYSYSVTGLDVTFTNTSTGGTTYLWDFGDGTTSTDPDPVHTYAGQNTYNVTLIVSNGVCSDTIVQQVVVGFVGIEENSAVASMSVYPNPAHSSVIIDLGAFSGKVGLRVYDVMGRVVIERSILMLSNTDQISVSVEDLPAGLYRITAENDVQVASTTLLKQ